MDIKELDLVDPNTHWYYQAKLVAIRAALARAGFTGGDVVDVGAGSGFFSLAVTEGMAGGHAWCIDPNYPDESLGGRGRSSLHKQLPREGWTQADTYLFIDVLEHVEDDAKLLKEYVASANPGALFVITVPAFMSLWSGHDVFLEHYRRYRRSEVKSLAKRSDLEIVMSRYLFGLTFVPLWLVRKWKGTREAKSDLRPVPDFLNRLLAAMLAAEHRVNWHPVFGSSVLLVGRKPS